MTDRALALVNDALGPPPPPEMPAERFAPGGSFILDAPDVPPAVWGTGSEVLWARGEALMLVAPQGVGKTTLAGQLARGRLGLAARVLDWPIEPGQRRVLYLACDRPAQAARSLRRQFRETDRDVLNERLVVWQGPPPADFARQPDTLVEMARAADADTVIIDSLKDVAIGLSEDEVGARAVAAGVQVLELHHQTKRGAGGVGKPTTLADVYGSVWITSGAGSVLLLWGEAGDPVVDLRHLKQPAEEIGPVKLLHEHTTGITTVHHSTDVLALAKASPGGVTIATAARAMFETDKPTAAQREKARRKLDRLAADGHLTRQEGTRGGLDGSSPTVYCDPLRIAVGEVL